MWLLLCETASEPSPSLGVGAARDVEEEEMARVARRIEELAGTFIAEQRTVNVGVIADTESNLASVGLELYRERLRHTTTKKVLLEKPDVEALLAADDGRRGSASRWW